MKLVEGTQRIAQGDLDTRIEVTSRDELGRAGRGLQRHDRGSAQGAARSRATGRSSSSRRWSRRPSELGRIQRQVLLMEKMASLGKLAATVAHELNNPLGGILNYAKLVERVLREDTLDEANKREIQRYLAAIQQESRRSGDIVRNLLLFARPSQTRTAPAHLSQIIERSLLLVRHRMEMSSITSDFQPPSADDQVTCDADQIQQVIVALLVNAIEAMEEGGNLHVAITPMSDTIEVVVADTGVGIAEEALPHIFEPFFSTKDKESGVGLGLAVVYGIVQRHDGTIDVTSQPGQGTTFTIRLPRGRRRPPATTRKPHSMTQPQASILIVDDELSVRDSLLHWFRKDGFRRRPRPPAPTWRCRRWSRARFDIVLLDIKMPGMDGMELQSRIHAIDPKIVVIMMTAFASVDTAVRALKQGAFDYVTKPIDPDELSHLVARALKERRLEDENTQLARNHRRAVVGGLRHRRQPGHAQGAGADPPGGADQRHRAHPRRERHRQGAGRAHHPRQQRAQVLPHRARQLRRPAREPARERALRPREGRLHRRAVPAQGPLRDGRRRHALPRRDRQPSRPRCRWTSCASLETSEVTRLGGTRPGQGGLPRHLRHQRGPGEDGGARDASARISTIASTSSPSTLPPLRERREDIPLLAAHFLEQASPCRWTSASPTSAPRPWRSSMAYDWPGNVRELANAIERAMVVSRRRDPARGSALRRARGAGRVGAGGRLAGGHGKGPHRGHPRPHALEHHRSRRHPARSIGPPSTTRSSVRPAAARAATTRTVQAPVMRAARAPVQCPGPGQLCPHLVADLPTARCSPMADGSPGPSATRGPCDRRASTPSSAFDTSRGQYNSTELLGQLLATDGPRGPHARRRRRGSVHPHPHLRLRRGAARRAGPAVVSTYRLDNALYGLPRPTDLLLLERLAKEAVHELGHTYGLVHCHHPSA